MPTPTTRNGFRKPDVGSDNNTWGANLNAAIFDLVDSSLDGWTTISTSGATTLTATQYVANQARQRFLHYTAPSSGTITIPSVEKWYIVWAENADVTLTTGGVSATVKAGSIALVVCDGSDCTKVQDNDFNGAELTNVGTPTSNGSVVNKAYADGLALAQSDLPGQNSGTLYNSVFSGGAPDSGAWRRVHPESTSSNTGKVLKSTGTDGYPETALQWAWDGYQGVVTKSANYTVVLTDRAKLISCSGTFTLGLTSSATLGANFYCRVVNTGTGIITIDPDSSETITLVGKTSASTLSLGPAEGVDIYCDGSNIVAVMAQRNTSGPHVFFYENALTVAPTRGGSQVTRTLNASNVYVDIGASLVSYQVILPPGTYRFEARGPAYGCNGNQIRIQNITDGTTAVTGTPNVAADFGSGLFNYAESVALGVVTITASKTFELQHWAAGALNTAAPATGAFGIAASGSGYSQIYASLAVTRVGP